MKTTINLNQADQQQDTQQVNANIDISQQGKSTIATVTSDSVDAPLDNAQDVQTQDTNKDTADTQQAFDNQIKAESDLKTDLENKGVNFDNLAKEFDENGQLSNESLQALEKAGYPKSVVDAYIHGLEATADKFVSDVISMVGSKEEYQRLVSYIQTQPDTTINAFNALIESGNLNQIKLAINGLKSDMVRTYGTNGSTIMAGNNVGLSAFKSDNEMVQAMSDPRYGKDPAYTQEVYRKVQMMMNR